jgi:hypothetical protein
LPNEFGDLDKDFDLGHLHSQRSHLFRLPFGGSMNQTIRRISVSSSRLAAQAHSWSGNITYPIRASAPWERAVIVANRPSYHRVQKCVANHVIRPRVPHHCHRLWFSLACEPNYLTMRVDYSTFALSIEVMSSELRKDSKRRWLWQAEVRSQ